jgi:hypothetical protein
MYNVWKNANSTAKRQAFSLFDHDFPGFTGVAGPKFQNNYAFRQV